MNGPVVDLSFKNLEHISGNKCSLSFTPLHHIFMSFFFSQFVSFFSAAAHEEPHSGLRPLKTNSERKYLSRSLRFSYNKIRDLSDLTWTVNYLMSEPLKLGWLDLSYNQITKIEPVRILCLFFWEHSSMTNNDTVSNSWWSSISVIICLYFGLYLLIESSGVNPAFRFLYVLTSFRFLVIYLICVCCTFTATILQPCKMWTCWESLSSCTPLHSMGIQ